METSLKPLRNLYKCSDKSNFISCIFFFKVRIVCNIRYIIPGVSWCDVGGKQAQLFKVELSFLVLQLFWLQSPEGLSPTHSINFTLFIYSFTSSLSMSTLQCFQQYFDIFAWFQVLSFPSLPFNIQSNPTILHF